jgi:hydroxypyruvate isomerase
LGGRRTRHVIHSGREAEFRDGAAKAIAYATVLGTPRLHVMAGLLPKTLCA